MSDITINRLISIIILLIMIIISLLSYNIVWDLLIAFFGAIGIYHSVRVIRLAIKTKNDRNNLDNTNNNDSKRTL